MDYKINKLSAQEIQELSFDRALRIIEENSNTLADVGAELFDEIGEACKNNIRVDQLKSLKTTLIEMNRALKSVVQNG